MNSNLNFELRGDVITLDALLKALGWAESGGAAKMMIADGQVQVNGEVELRRGRKLRHGDRVQTGTDDVRICGAGQQGAAKPKPSASS